MDARQYAPATQRNREAILAVLSENLMPQSNILEIASGTGEHAIFFASNSKSWHWIPSDINPTARESIVAWKNTNNTDNLALPLDINVTQDNWSELVADRAIDAIVNINMIHISPWSACLGLMKGAGQILSGGNILYLYGPFKRNGEHTAVSNARFDESLRDRSSTWGVRDLEAVIETAATANFQLQQIVEMPANNLSVIFVKS
ncbi:DUF938 domain-containing protein [Waterburya agarophytonicola K14]|uniref:DUF938 domain-containing protein n=1 Tax=Waterburya agarophytonicola KI4 TaxID=2874699 RepID=A0A964BM32_9CYAN|nr:DUF938 domain-containing protein [Waterburya agarophytonicola]MCC0175569.1 DUF938 domain-containing protein [Waterburya agarophytonicola KI4]